MTNSLIKPERAWLDAWYKLRFYGRAIVLWGLIGLCGLLAVCMILKMENRSIFHNPNVPMCNKVARCPEPVRFPCDPTVYADGTPAPCLPE
jgi:hypothetical protein